MLGIIVFLGLHTFVSIKGRELLTKKLRSVFQGEVTIGRVTTRFPLQLIVKDVEVKNWFKVRKAVTSNGTLDILVGNFVINDLRLEGAEFNLEKRKRPSKPVSGNNVPEQGTKTMPVNLDALVGTSEQFFLPQHIIFKRLIISDGSFTYADYTKEETPVKFAIKNLNVSLENFQWPFFPENVVSFKITGRVPWENLKEEGNLLLEGWINFYKKDMRANLEAKAIDGIFLYPYYSSWINIDKERLEKATLNFTSNITSLNNDVNAACHLELTQIVFKPRDEQEKEPRAEKVTNIILGIFKAMDQGKVVLNFNLKTKLDSPEFGLGVIQEALNDKVYQFRQKQDSGTVQVIKFPGKIVEGTLASATDLTKSLIKGTLNIGKEFRKAMKISFSKENASVGNNTTVVTNQTE